MKFLKTDFLENKSDHKLSHVVHSLVQMHGISLEIEPRKKNRIRTITISIMTYLFDKDNHSRDNRIIFFKNIMHGNV
jgi:hypothetical protein